MSLLNYVNTKIDQNLFVEYKLVIQLIKDLINLGKYFQAITLPCTLFVTNREVYLRKGLLQKFWKCTECFVAT
jgi:hypothetical protein